MDNKQWMAHYNAAPEAVQDYLLDTQAVKNESKAQTALAYDHDAWDRVMDVVWDAIFGGLNKADFSERLKRLAGDRKPEDVERAVLLNVVLPLGDLVMWDVEARLQELGAPFSEIQGVSRISLRPVSYGAAARRMASQAKLSLFSEESARRLRELLVSYIKGVRTIEQVKEMLQRALGDGGLGLNREQAETFAKSMLDFLAVTTVMSEQDYADYLTKQQEAGQSPKSQIQNPKAGEETEVLAMGAGMPRVGAGVAGALDQAVELAAAQSGLANLDEYLSKRLRNIISTRLRDVRNALQIKDMLARDQKLGGLGLEAAEAERVGGVIEKVYQEYRGQIGAEEKKSIEATMEEQKTKIQERKQRESAEHAKWYEEKVKSSRGEEALKAVLSAPAPSLTRQPANSQTRQPVSRPVIDSVQPAMRLVGLAEELGNMTLAEFRRQAKTPDQAAQRVKQKLETLRQESFDRWTEGVQAWRRSPLQQQYLKLVADSFASGKPVAQLVEERRAVDQSLPTPEEIGAIISLNSQIQF